MGRGGGRRPGEPEAAVDQASPAVYPAGQAAFRKTPIGSFLRAVALAGGRTAIPSVATLEGFGDY